MNEIIEFLNNNKFGSLATNSYDKPDLRPFEMVFYSDQRMYFYTTVDSDVANQLGENSNICFCATDQSYNYVKVSGSVIFSDKQEDKDKILENSEFAKEIFKKLDINKMKVFYLEHGECKKHLHSNNQTIVEKF
ncbi:MAG: pyridoxamine 5'-phosphate oxidase family protein [Candidatus Galacturonibacter soehngenii]|nr:pyridoxamine 5'-phosphate oxidase family protein [Candidatus Galacturonibacter soehngenii]